MKRLYFKQNQYLTKNHFLVELKKEISKMFHKYFQENTPVPIDFEDFDKEISNLIIKIQENQDEIKKEMRKRNISKIKYIEVKNWKSKKFIR